MCDHPHGCALWDGKSYCPALTPVQPSFLWAYLLNNTYLLAGVLFFLVNPDSFTAHCGPQLTERAVENQLQHQVGKQGFAGTDLVLDLDSAEALTFPSV
jgi:hypothetical protein